MRREAASGELALVPLMNVFCILVPFLLMTGAFVQLAVTDLHLPVAARQGEADAETPARPAQRLNLTLFITAEGFLLAGSGGVLDAKRTDGGAEKRSGADRTLIPLTVVGKDRDGNAVLDYDFAALTERLVRVKDAFPERNAIIVLPENQVRYETIIKALDASRECREERPDGLVATRALFPSPVLADGIVL